MLNALPISTKIVVFLFLFTFLFSVALEESKAELITSLKSGLMAKSLLINFILLPLTGIILTWIFHLSAEISSGFLTVASAPGGLLSLHFARVAKGNLRYAIGLVFLLSILSIIITPLLIHLIFPGIVVINLPIFSVIGILSLLVLPPLLLGQIVRYYLRGITPILQKIASFSSIALFITFTILTSTLRDLDAEILAWNGIAAIIAFILAAWSISWWLSGADIGSRKVLAIGTSMRNIAICSALSSMGVLGPKAEVVIIGFNAISTPMNLVFAIAISRINKSSKGS
ncbi:putative Na+-dependent transporter [Rivularia sp. PCC 7116]|jgi:BASS family bile acid:Na+ symporter|uniref:bile acid:sodium symporter n=1 Tax=Rivularia sp. PCC 7116 TaxID=373994 RepID=UPI00029EFFAF|nr:bile acid:sodium symporter [Rivularia sp. PCC 7116]AFY55411.1 putative Na+-dependent transporter [Rivularia sp. PCC 7116]